MTQSMLRDFQEEKIKAKEVTGLNSLLLTMHLG